MCLVFNRAVVEANYQHFAINLRAEAARRNISLLQDIIQSLEMMSCSF